MREKRRFNTSLIPVLVVSAIVVLNTLSSSAFGQSDLDPNCPARLTQDNKLEVHNLIVSNKDDKTLGCYSAIFDFSIDENDDKLTKHKIKLVSYEKQEPSVYEGIEPSLYIFDNTTSVLFLPKCCTPDGEKYMASFQHRHNLPPFTPSEGSVKAYDFFRNSTDRQPKLELGDVTEHYTTDDDPVRKGPYLLYNNDKTAMTVLWQTDDTPESTTIEWGVTKSYGNGPIQVSESGTGKDDHQFSYEIKDLGPGALTYYRVTVDGKQYEGSFRAAPADSASSLSFYAYGDSRSAWYDVVGRGVVFDQINDRLLADVSIDSGRRQTFTLDTGDYALIGLWEAMWDWDVFNRKHAGTGEFLSKMPLAGVLGNHEGYIYMPGLVDTQDFGSLYKKYFPYNMYQTRKRYYQSKYHFNYSFDYGPVHFAVLDTWTFFETYLAHWFDSGAEVKVKEAQLTWLDDDLQASSKPWKIVTLHYPIWDCKTANTTIQEQLTPIIEKNGVLLVLQGHNHFYCHSEKNGVVYLTLGGAGAELGSPVPPDDRDYVISYHEKHHFARVDIDGNTMVVTVIDKSGNVLDTVTIIK